MRSNRYLAVSMLLSGYVLFSAGCAHFTHMHSAELENPRHMEDLRSGEPAILATGTSKQIRETAIADARADIAAGRPRIAFTGGFASWPVGVPEKEFELVRPWPRVPLPTGCTSPWLQQAAIYAEAYNREILSVLRQQRNFWKNGRAIP